MGRCSSQAECRYRVSGAPLGTPYQERGRFDARHGQSPARGDAIKGTYVGYVTGHDPLYDFLSGITRDLAGACQSRPAFRAFRLRGSNEVYAYEEKSSGTKIICKFYGPKFPSDPELATAVAQREHDNLNTLRGYRLTGSPHHVIRPLGIRPDINSALAVEYFHGEELIYAIEQATHRQDGACLFARLQALAYFLATQHNRTVTGETVDFWPVCDYFDRIIDGLHRRGRIGQWDIDEFAWLRDIWRGRLRMWEDRQVWLHGDATPTNFLFGPGIDVAAIDLERSKRGDRVWDVGRLAGELQHAFMITTGHKHGAEPFIRYFLSEYCSHLPDHDLAFQAVTGRVPYYMGLTLLRIARNDYITNEYNGKLIRQAKKLLRAP